MTTICTVLAGERPFHELLGWGHEALVRPLASDVEIVVGWSTTRLHVAGAFTRTKADLVRASGGADFAVDGTVLYAALALSAPNALVPDAHVGNLLNRYVRPLLRALKHVGVNARYSDRDWIGTPNGPIASLGFARLERTERTLIETCIAVSGGLWLEPTRASFLGKLPTHLHALNVQQGPKGIAKLIVDSYISTSNVEPLETTFSCAPCKAAEAENFAFTHVAPIPIGWVGATQTDDGLLHVGGEWMAASDVVTELERVVSTCAVEEIPHAVQATLGRKSAGTFGIQTLTPFVNVIRLAREGHNASPNS